MFSRLDALRGLVVLVSARFDPAVLLFDDTRFTAYRFAWIFHSHPVTFIHALFQWKNEAQRHTTISRPLEDFSPCQLRLRNRMWRCRLSEKRGRRLVLSARGQGNRRDQCVLVLHLATVSNADHQTRQGGVRPDDMGRDVYLS